MCEGGFPGQTLLCNACQHPCTLKKLCCCISLGAQQDGKWDSELQASFACLRSSRDGVGYCPLLAAALGDLTFCDISAVLAGALGSQVKTAHSPPYLLTSYPLHMRDEKQSFRPALSLYASTGEAGCPAQLGKEAFHRQHIGPVIRGSQHREVWEEDISILCCYGAHVLSGWSVESWVWDSFP